jgi:4-cresol dehydrogenase (hydroxylating)
VHDLLGVRGVLGNGTVFETGGIWEHVGSVWPSHHSRYTAGPDLTGMFSQSNFGIVTRMAFRLLHRPERYAVFWGTAEDRNLEALVDGLADLGRQRVIRPGSVNVGYANRFVQGTRSLSGGGAPPPDEPWNFYVLVPGTIRVAEATVEELTSRIGPLCRTSAAYRVHRGGDPYRELPPFLHPLVQPLLGTPDDASIRLIYAMTGTPLPEDSRALDADATPFGMKCYIPVVPFSARHARRAAEIVRDIGARFGLDVKLSLFGDARALTTIHFRSDVPEQVARAEQVEAAIWDEMVAAGYLPYRASIDQMDRLSALRPAFFALVGRLKAALDPNGIISPGRYGPR